VTRGARQDTDRLPQKPLSRCLWLGPLAGYVGLVDRRCGPGFENRKQMQPPQRSRRPKDGPRGLACSSRRYWLWRRCPLWCRASNAVVLRRRLRRSARDNQRTRPRRYRSQRYVVPQPWVMVSTSGTPPRRRTRARAHRHPSCPQNRAYLPPRSRSQRRPHRGTSSMSRDSGPAPPSPYRPWQAPHCAPESAVASSVWATARPLILI
jgi:hypothetical protein